MSSFIRAPPHVYVPGPDGEIIYQLNCPTGPASIREVRGYSERKARKLAKRVNSNQKWRLARERGAETAKHPAASSASYKPRTKRLEITLTNGISLLVPVAYIEGLRDATAVDLRQIEIFGVGSALVFPALDEVVSVHALIDGVFGSKAWMRDIGRLGRAAKSEAKSTAAREHGKKGGRPRKAAA